MRDLELIHPAKHGILDLHFHRTQEGEVLRPAVRSAIDLVWHASGVARDAPAIVAQPDGSNQDDYRCREGKTPEEINPFDPPSTSERGKRERYDKRRQRASLERAAVHEYDGAQTDEKRMEGPRIFSSQSGQRADDKRTSNGRDGAAHVAVNPKPHQRQF